MKVGVGDPRSDVGEKGSEYSGKIRLEVRATPDVTDTSCERVMVES